MRFRGRLLVLVSLVFAAAIPAPVSAQNQPAGQGLEISPPLIERSVDPGQTITLDIKLRNITTATLATTGSIDDFVAEGEEGRPKLLVDSTELSPYTFKPWVKSITRLTLASQEVKTAQVVIQVPQNASPGGHYGVIRFSGVPPELEGTGVSLSASLGTLVLLNVSGDVVKKAAIAELYAMQNDKKSSFFEKGPIILGLRVRNEGSVHIKPTGTLRVTNTFGREVAVLSINPTGGNILPESVRKFEQALDKSPLIGKYTVEANVQYEGQNLNQKISFWVIPYKLIAIGLGVLILAGILLRMAIRKYNRYIINKAGEKSDK